MKDRRSKEQNVESTHLNEFLEESLECIQKEMSGDLETGIPGAFSTEILREDLEEILKASSLCEFLKDSFCTYLFVG